MAAEPGGGLAWVGAGVAPRPGDGGDVPEHHRRWLEAHPNRDLVWLRFMTRQGFDVHHIDGDHSNNTPENLALVEHDDHMRLHGEVEYSRLRRAPGKRAGIWGSMGADFVSRQKMPGSQHRVLWALIARADYKGHILTTMAAVRRDLGMTNANASEAFHAIEDMGLIRKEKHGHYVLNPKLVWLAKKNTYMKRGGIPGKLTW